tara:strand:- start:63 stop:278 length:216 start_codon:yes stop_codon:yes gene_type:complete
MIDISTQLAELVAEQKQLAQNYKEAENVMRNCEKKLLQLQGAIAFAEKQLNQDPDKKETDKKETDKKTTDS